MFQLPVLHVFHPNDLQLHSRLLYENVCSFSGFVEWIVDNILAGLFIHVLSKLLCCGVTVKYLIAGQKYKR